MKPQRLLTQLALWSFLRRARTLNAQRVYYGVFDTQLVVPMPAGWGGLVGNRAFQLR